MKTIEEILYRHLKTVLPAALYTETPPMPPDEWYLLDKLSDRETDHIRTASFVLQAYAGTKLAAARLSAMGVDRLETLLRLDEVAAARLESEYPFPATDTKAYRYQAVFNITYYEGSE